MRRYRGPTHRKVIPRRMPTHALAVSEPVRHSTNRLYAVPATGFLAGALSCFFCASCLCFVNCCCLFFSLFFLPPLSPIPPPLPARVTCSLDRYAVDPS